MVSRGGSGRWSEGHSDLCRSLLLTSSANGLETVVFSQLADGGGWERWELEDSGRAEVPLVNGKETQVVGMALSLCSTASVKISRLAVRAGGAVCHLCHCR